MTKPSLTQHCTVMGDKDIFMTPNGYLALIIPGEATLHEFILDDRAKIILGRDLIASGAEGMAERIRSLENANASLREALDHQEAVDEGVDI